MHPKQDWADQGGDLVSKKVVSFAALVALGLVVAAGAGASHSATVINGAGSTFVSPLVSVWTPALGSAFDYTIQYSAIGSGGGIQAIQNRSVNFGASDAPMTPDQFSGCNGCVQIPWALAGTSIPYNIPGLVVPKNTNLRLSGPVIAKIYMGQITNWNDPAIKLLNPKATLPDLKITPVYRTGNSGTTYNFTDYLSSVSPDWKTNIGTGQSVNWPAGTGASGSAGVAGVVANTPGAMCYVDTAFAVTNHLHFASIQNAAGRFINPSIKNVAAAGDAVTKVPANNEIHIVNPPRSLPAAYPIATFTYIIVPLKTQMATQLRKMIFWALTTGQQSKYTAKLWFAPIPHTVLVASEKTMKQIQTG
jgi:phosphate transport system substrate-binding protein